MQLDSMPAKLAILKKKQSSLDGLVRDRKEARAAIKTLERELRAERAKKEKEIAALQVRAVLVSR